MLTLDKIKIDFTYIKAWTGNSECYQGTDQFVGHGNFCDLYFRSKNKIVTQKQVEIFNNFKVNFEKYVSEIERYIKDNLTSIELNKLDEIRKNTLSFDILEIPQDNYKYDMVLVCGKTFRQLFLLKKNIDLRVEFQSGKIKSIKRTKDTTVDNET